MNISISIVILVVGLVILVQSFVLFRLWMHYNSLTRTAGKKDLMEILNQLLKQLHQNEKAIEVLNEKFAKESDLSKANFKKLGFKRFNPFSDTGGDQSFCLSLLDENLDGFVISSLHSRENTRIYAKKIVGGKPAEQTLSKEEQEVINQAIK